MEENNRILPIEIAEEMKKSYIDYSMSVIVGRALPDVRDGLKPVHRRILYSMSELNLTPDKPYRKSARIVGDVLGKYHPHGDSAVYLAMVRMAQDFSTRGLLVDGHGNFGSVDGDSPAAMRYTEARMSKLALELLRDIDKETVDFVPNFDESLKEPAVLPSRYPNLLVNGSNGIAVGMATSIPPHNLGEVIDATVHLIDNEECSVDDLMKFVKGPDFPTSAIIMGKENIAEAYRTYISIVSKCKLVGIWTGSEDTSKFVPAPNDRDTRLGALQLFSEVLDDIPTNETELLDKQVAIYGLDCLIDCILRPGDVIRSEAVSDEAKAMVPELIAKFMDRNYNCFLMSEKGSSATIVREGFDWLQEVSERLLAGALGVTYEKKAATEEASAPAAHKTPLQVQEDKLTAAYDELDEAYDNDDEDKAAKIESKIARLKSRIADMKAESAAQAQA